MVRRIAAPWGLSENGKLLRNILLTLLPDGTIESVEYGVGDIDCIPFTEYYNGILIPGMVNAHCHLELSCMKGYIPENTGLVGFFNYLSSDRPSYDANQTMVQDKLMWNEGVSAVGDVSNSVDTMELKAASKIRYRTFAEYYGFSDPEFLLRKVDPIMESAGRLALDAVPVPHSTYLVSREGFTAAGKYPILSTHFMESRSEYGFFQGRGEMYEHVRQNFHRFHSSSFVSPADMVINCLPRDIHLVLVHCTRMESEDLSKLLDYFDDVTFVLCPRSNMYIERSTPPVEMLYNSGCQVAIGTDSLSSNSSLSMAAELDLLKEIVPFETLLTWATAGGAHALGYDRDLGYFRPGLRPGVLLVNEKIRRLV